MNPMSEEIPAIEKIGEIRAELKRTGLWKKELPDWVMNYDTRKVPAMQDFTDWLQFVYLPNCVNDVRVNKKAMIAPQAQKFFQDDIQKGRLLQLLVELDAMI